LLAPTGYKANDQQHDHSDYPMCALHKNLSFDLSVQTSNQAVLKCLGCA
jgi:hypothetical protein